MKRSSIALVVFWIGCSLPAYADDYSSQWGPALGSKAPDIAAPDQSGEARDLGSLAGERGLLLFMNRSADW
ncbi:MAG: hypothetical protein O7C67_06535 [Gammaproteobacteria bacterium]|nr:hypothetical protein [Gammaproteobacteria bacterium]